ncbi:hypothetical protein Tco_1182384 [Tanacetum coccineum]
MDKSESYMAAPEHRECYKGLIKSYDLDKTLFSTYGKVYSLKRSQKDKHKDEDPSVGLDRGLKKRKTSKDAEPTKEEPEFEVAYSDMLQDQKGNLGNDDDKPMKETVSKRDWFTKPTQPQEPIDPDWNVGKTPQQGQTQSWLMTLASSADKPSKTFDELMRTPPTEFLWNMTLKGMLKALSKLDWKNPEGGNLTLVEVMRKHGYGYLKEIVVRRADNDLYRFKEGDFPHLRINDIKGMLLLVVQNRLINLSGDDVSDFVIALRMFTRSLVIQKRVEDLQLELKVPKKI